MPRRNLKNSNINCKDKETQHSNLRTNQGYQPLHLEAKLGPYDLCFAPLNVSENKMVPMCNTQLDFICHEYGIHNFFIKNSGQTWLLFTCYLWGWIYSKTWSVKLEIVFVFTLKTFGEEWTTQMSSSSKKLPGVNVRDQEFHVKSIWLCRASKSEMSNWRKVFSIYNSEDIRRRMNNKTFFFIEKSPSVNVREQKFHVKSIWSSR